MARYNQFIRAGELVMDRLVYASSTHPQPGLLPSSFPAPGAWRTPVSKLGGGAWGPGPSPRDKRYISPEGSCRLDALC